jgi:hypothetical protein
MVDGEFEVLEQKHKSKMERATIVNKYISSLKKAGDPDYTGKLEEALKDLIESINIQNHSGDYLFEFFLCHCLVLCKWACIVLVTPLQSTSSKWISSNREETLTEVKYYFTFLQNKLRQ